MENTSKQLSKEFDLPLTEAEKILEKAVAGGEITAEFSASEWYEKRFFGYIRLSPQRNHGITAL